MGMMIYGKDSLDYAELDKALIAITSLSIGFFPNELFHSSNIKFTAVFLTFYYFFVIFFLISVFASIYIDLYRKVVMEHGEKYQKKPDEKCKIIW